MGRKVLVVVLCWLALSEALGETEKKVNSSVIKDNESAESAPKLYQKIYSGYASGVPYGAYSVRVPFVIQPASSQLKQTSVVPHATLLDSLKDSYGKFTESPHAAPYKTTFPQQFVQLQGLPPHLAQPLVSTASSNGVHYNSIPFVLGSDNYKVSEFSANPTPLAHFTSHSQPLVYAANVHSFVPNGPSHVLKFSSTPHHISPHYISTVAKSPSEFSSANHYKTPSPTSSQLSLKTPSEFSGTPHPKAPQHLSSSKTPIAFSSITNHKSPYRTSSQHSSSKNPSNVYSISHLKIPHYSSSQLSSNKTPTEFYSTNPHQTSSQKSSSHHRSSPSQQNTPGGQQHSTIGHISSAPAHHTHQETHNSQAASSSDKIIKHENEQKASPAQTSVTTYVNGKKTVINIETKPPLPLLDLNLLEPLTFDNPLVPQVQHFLPKIEMATYHKLPKNLKNPKNIQKEFVVTKTKSYDSGIINEKPHQDVRKKKQNKSPPQNKHTTPSINVHGHPDGEEFSYEINTPNHKETYNEKVLKYNKQSDTKPVEYSYNEHTHKEPEVYSFVHTSKEPLKVTHVEYGSENDSPKHVVQQVELSENQRDNEENNNRPTTQEDEEQSEDESDESSTENDDDGPPPHAYQEEPPRNSHTERHEFPAYMMNNEYKEHVKLSDKDEHARILPSTPQPFQHYSYHSSSSKSRPAQHHPENRHQLNEHRHHQELPKFHPQVKFYEENLRPSQNNGEYKNHYSTSTPSRLLKAEHREQERPDHKIKTEIIMGSPKYYSEPLIVHKQPFQPITPEYEKDDRILRTHKPHSAPIKVDPNQHVRLSPTKPQTDTYFAYPSPTTQKLPQQQTHHGKLHSKPDTSSEPHIYEKSKQIIIKEQEETPDEMHQHMEQVLTGIVDREENSDEDFEKAYKESAFGFPAYEKTAEDIEKDIYDPDSYGSPRFHYEYNSDDPTFQQYEKEGDRHPKSARLAYKDARDNNQEEYYLDFSVNQPESFLDRHKSKIDYYKMYKKNRPEKIFSHVNDAEGKKSEKFVEEPSFDFGFDSSSVTQKPKQSNLFARYTTAPIKFGFGYSKNAPRDSSAYDSQLFNKFNRPVLTEPRFHYGFSPISAPLVVDSELAAMASNVSPESEKAGTRKKIYKENWYIKKTSTKGNKPS